MTRCSYLHLSLVKGAGFTCEIGDVLPFKKLPFLSYWPFCVLGRLRYAFLYALTRGCTCETEMQSAVKPCPSVMYGLITFDVCCLLVLVVLIGFFLLLWVERSLLFCLLLVLFELVCM